MSRANKLRLILYFLGFGLPLVAIFGCEGTGEMARASMCIIPLDLFLSYANFVRAVFVISSLTLGLPILVYAVVVIALVEGAVRPSREA